MVMKVTRREQGTTTFAFMQYTHLGHNSAPHLTTELKHHHIIPPLRHSTQSPTHNPAFWCFLFSAQHSEGKDAHLSHRKAFGTVNRPWLEGTMHTRSRYPHPQHQTPLFSHTHALEFVSTIHKDDYGLFSTAPGYGQMAHCIHDRDTPHPLVFTHAHMDLLSQCTVAHPQYPFPCFYTRSRMSLVPLFTKTTTTSLTSPLPCCIQWFWLSETRGNVGYLGRSLRIQRVDK